MQFFRCKYRVFFLIVCYCCVVYDKTSAQISDTTAVLAKDTAVVPVFRDSAVIDLTKSVRVSNEGLDQEIEYGAKDSMWFDVKNKQLHLYGDASVKYTSLTVKAGYILMDYARNEITADQFPDSTGRMAGSPDFKDGDQQFTASKLRYNFKSKKGIIYEARTKQEDLYVLGERAKFVGGATDDTTSNKRSTIYNSNALLTTCDDPHPHFGIRTRKLKVIPDKLVVTGLSLLEIGGVPTPLILPFGFYPITKTRKAGLIIPRDYESSRIEGFGLRDFGWYQPINQHIDAKLLFNAYTSGSWGVAADTRYKQLYRYDGNFLLTINNRVRENEFAEKEAAKSFGINWTHQQDAKAHPSRKFGGSVNIETNRNQNRNQNDFASVYQNQLRSNLNFSKTFPGKPYSFTAAMTHGQNTQTREMNISLPNLTFQMQQIYPLKRKVQVGKERWYEKITLSYNSKLQNNFRTVDTLLFTRKTLETSQMGIQHNMNSNVALKIFKYINVSPRIEYEENWYPYTIRKELLNEVREVQKPIIDPDTKEIVGYETDSLKSQFGIDTTRRVWGFNAFRKYNAGVSLNTNLFLTKQFKKGWFRGVRHRMAPSVGVGYGPDFTNPKFNYFRTVETDLRRAYNDTLTYGIYDEGIFGRPSFGTRSIAINWGITNLLEMKYRGRRDSADRKVRIFDNLSFSGTYSVTADSLKWSTVSTGGLFRFFKGITQITWGVTFDPYIADKRGARINRFVLDERGRLVRLTRLGLTVNNAFTFKQIQDAFSGKSKDETDKPTGGVNAKKKDQLTDWFENFSFVHRLDVERSLIPTGYGTERDTFFVRNHTLGISGDIPLNAKWGLGLGNISYDFVSNRLVYPDLRIRRDLHCWELSLSWQPERGTYLFSINVKPGTLEFLKLPYRKNNFDARF